MSTPNLNLNKALSTDIPDVETHWNQNWDKIDNGFGSLSDSVAGNTTSIGILQDNYIRVYDKAYKDLCPKDGNGKVTDWLLAINQAMIDADAQQRPIQLPYGNVPISNTIMFNKNNLRMDGMGKHLTIIKPSGAFPAIKFNGNSTTGIYYCEVNNLQIDGQNTATVGIQLNYSRECWINDSIITKCVKGVTGSNAWTNGIRSTEILQNTDTNLELGYQCNDFTLIDVRLDGAGNYGLHATDYSAGITLIGCCVQSNGKDGVLFDAGRGITIQGGYFENNNTSNTAGTADIRFSGSVMICTGITLSGMTIFDGTVQASIILDKASGVSVSGLNAGLLSGGTTSYVLQTSSNTANVFVGGVYANLVSAFPYNDIGSAITRIDSRYLFNVAWQNHTTANRPVSPIAWQQFGDNTVGRPIWRNSANNRWISADGVAPENRGINVAVTTGATTFSTGFGFNEADTSYAAVVTPSWNTTVWVTGKLVNGFVVNFGTAAPSGATIDWSIKR
jgi:hypothetical protein